MRNVLFLRSAIILRFDDTVQLIFLGWVNGQKWSPITVGSQNQHLMLGMNVPLSGWLSVSSEVLHKIFWLS